MGACLLVEMLKGLTGCTGVPKAGDDEGAAEDRGATPRPVNMAPAMSLCLRRLLGLRFMATFPSVSEVEELLWYDSDQENPR